MKRTLTLLAVLALAGCNAAETGSNEEACQEADRVIAQIEEYSALATLTDEQENIARQWEFKLAEAAVVATDHDLSADIRDLADAAGNVAENLDNAEAKTTLDSMYETVTQKCH